MAHIVTDATFEEISENLSFPYPEQGGTPRPAGFGCLDCVHSTYCPALYWFRRYTQEQPDNNNGRSCLSFSNNPADIVKTVNDFDREENDRRNREKILTEPNRNGITDDVTASSRKGFVG